MKSFVFLLIALVSTVAQASEAKYCNGQVIQDSWGLYFPNGKKVKDSSTYFYPNGQILKDNWGSYFPSGQRLADSWNKYYPNGQVTKDSWNVFYHNGRVTKDSWNCFWANGTKMEPCRKKVIVKARFSREFTFIYTLDINSGEISNFEFQEYDSAKKLLTVYSADPESGVISDIDAICDF